MHDETHHSGTGDEPADSVLRPFEAPEPPPLPPIEPSQVVPEPPAAGEPIVEEAVVEEPVVDAEVVPPPPIEALADDPWTPAAEPDEVRVADDEDAVDPGGEAAAETADDDLGEFDGPVDDEALDDAPVPALAGSGDSTAPLPAETITLPRKTFLVGLGILLGAVALFGLLWQTSGGDDGGDESAAPALAEEATRMVDDSETPDPTDGGVPTDEVDEPDTPASPEDDGLADDLAEARAEIAGLEAAVAELEDRPPPALDGSMLRRIVVGADAKFVSALPESVAVVGAFGGLSLIDPESNRVVANGNVANAATRVLRTSSFVWLTNYADNQLLRVDPATNTVAAIFPFEGPDGIDKLDNTLVVASFDGEFVARVDPNSGQILRQVDVGGKPTAVISHSNHGLWAAVFDTGEIVQIDPETFEILQRVVVGQGPVGISADPSFLWVSNHDEGTVAKVAPGSGEVMLTVEVGNGPTETAVGAGSVWVTVTDDGAVVEVDDDDGRILSRTPLGGANAGGGPTGISFAEGTLWIAMQGEQSVVRIDLR